MKLLAPKIQWNEFLATSLFSIALLSALTASAEVSDLDAAFKINGRVDDISESTNRSGLIFGVQMRDINYDGIVERTLVEQNDDGQFTLWLELRNVCLTIQRTDITSQRRGAQCGPMQIVIGHQQTLWIAFDALLAGDENQPDVQLSNVRFDLPNGNWQVGSPHWVKAWGIGMTEASVVNALQNSLSGKRKEMEAQIVKVAPAIFSQAINYLKHRQTTQEVAAQ